MDSRKRIVLSILGIGLLVLFFVILFRSSKGNPLSPNGPTPTPIRFGLISTFPPQNVEQTFPIPNLALLFEFNEKLDEDTINVTIEPETPIKIRTNDKKNTIIVQPLPEWQYNKEYFVTVDVKSEVGESLDKPVIFKLKPIEVTESDFETGEKDNSPGIPFEIPPAQPQKKS